MGDLLRPQFLVFSTRQSQDWRKPSQLTKRRAARPSNVCEVNTTTLLFALSGRRILKVHPCYKRPQLVLFGSWNQIVHPCACYRWKSWIWISKTSQRTPFPACTSSPQSRTPLPVSRRARHKRKFSHTWAVRWHSLNIAMYIRPQPLNRIRAGRDLLYFFGQCGCRRN